MAKGRGKYPYKFTPKRKIALKKAQAISARKRKILGKQRVKGGSKAAAIGVVAGIGLTAVGTGVVLGKQINQYKQADARTQRNAARKAQKTVSPREKEATRIAGAISPAHTPRDNPGTVIRTYEQILDDKNNGRYQTGCDCKGACHKHQTKVVTPGNRNAAEFARLNVDITNPDQARIAMTASRMEQQSRLGANLGGPGRQHAGGKVRWGDGGAVTRADVERKAEELGHSMSPFGSPDNELRSRGIIEKSLPRNLLKGEETGSLLPPGMVNPVGKGTMKRAISQHQNAKRSITEEFGLMDDTLLDMMIAEGEAIANTMGLRKRKGKKK